MNGSDVQDLADWLIDGARSAANSTHMFGETCERIVAAGLPLWRVGLFIRTLHPEIFGRSFIWKPGAEVEMNTADYHFMDSPDFQNSPLIIVFQQGIEVRARIDDPLSDRFPIVADLRAEGVTDYIALPLLFIDGSVHATSWTTKQPGGFTDDQFAALRRIVTPLARISEIITLTRTASGLLDTYVGNRAGERIMGGQIRRGHTETMNAGIWLSDLRGFTALSDRLPSETVVDILNQYFDCQVAAIRGHGGEVLKYMGDGLLAVFPIDEYVDDEQHVCARMLEAAQNPAPMSPTCNIRSATRSSAFASGWRCMSGRYCSAISAAAAGSTSPASVRPSISPRGWKRSRASCTARWWRRQASPRSAAAAGATSANFRSRVFQKPSASMAWSKRRRRK